MATIALYANQISQMTGMLKNVQTTVADYKETLFSLQNKALTISKSACELEEVISSIKASTQIQDDKMEALATFVTQTEEFVDEADRIDGNVKDVINERKDDFYEEYEYLRPECEKKKEKKSVVATIWGGIKSVGKSIGKGLKKAGEWCKEHWKAIVTVVIVIVAVVLICTGVGGILGAMAIGALLGALIGGLSGGIIAAVTGGNFWEGFEDGAFMGAISGIITGGLAGGNTAAALTLGKTMFIGGVSGSGSQFLSDLGDILIKGEDISIGELVINTVTAGVLGTAFAAAGYGLNKAFSWTKSLFKTKSGIDIETSYGKSSGKLDWNAIVSKKGETRVDHINRHAVPNISRETHGVFNGNPIDMVNDAWEQRHLVEPISDGMGGKIYNIPYKNAGYESGYINTGAQMDYITIVTMDESADLITAFPSFGDYHK